VDAALPSALFLHEQTQDGFVCAPSVPAAWEPGSELRLSAPIGRGFSLPPTCNALALAAFHPASLARLRPIMMEALHRRAAVAIFTDLALPDLPAAVEANPLSALPDGLAWANYLAADLRLEDVGCLPKWLGLRPETQRLPCLAQALVLAAMPCGGMGQCGACHVQTRQGWQATCEDGPVFDLESLLP
jgi:hypothetical protein